jgi:molecular chaperone DnaK
LRAAICIGCGIFVDAEIGNLRYPANDARRFASVLRQFCGFHEDDIFLITDDATTDACLPFRWSIIKVLTALCVNSKESPLDLLVFYFSGHGFAWPVDGTDYLIAKDTVSGAISDTAISSALLIKALASCNTDHTVLFLDACRVHHGWYKGVSSEPATVNLNALCPPGMVTFCSCERGQKSFESDDLKAGIFTKVLVRGLGKDGTCSTVQELDEYLRVNSPLLGKACGLPVQRPFTKVEPLGAKDLILVSNPVAVLRSAILSRWKEARLKASSAASRDKNSICDMVAIDFGTTNSLCGLYDRQQGIVLVKDSLGRTLVPSTIELRTDGLYRVGFLPQLGSILSKERYFSFPKRHFGLEMPYSNMGYTFLAKDLASLIVTSLKRNAEEFAGKVFDKAIVGVPVNFSWRQEADLSEAFRQAGFRQVRYMPELCAAALAYFWPSDFQNKLVSAMVIDLGGGTLDISAVQFDTCDIHVGVVYEIDDVDGDPNLGGIDYDRVIEDVIRNKAAGLEGYDIKGLNVSIEAERAKLAETPTDAAVSRSAYAQGRD